MGATSASLLVSCMSVPGLCKQQTKGNTKYLSANFIIGARFLLTFFGCLSRCLLQRPLVVPSVHSEVGLHVQVKIRAIQAHFPAN